MSAANFYWRSASALSASTSFHFISILPVPAPPTRRPRERPCIASNSSKIPLWPFPPTPPPGRRKDGPVQTALLRPTFSFRVESLGVRFFRQKNLVWDFNGDFLKGHGHLPYLEKRTVKSFARIKHFEWIPLGPWVTQGPSRAILF